MLITILIFLLASSGLHAQGLSSKINSIINQSGVRKVDFGIKVVSAKDGRTLYSHNEKKPMTPASNMKLATSTAALKYLGSDFSYSTKFYYVNGDLIVVGSGDPLLGDEITDHKNNRNAEWIFTAIVQELQKRKISQLNNIIVDSSIFDDLRVHPHWPKNQLNRYYATEVCGINFYGNCVDVLASSKGGRVSVQTFPSTRYVKIINKAQATSKRQNTIWCSRPPASNTITLYGKCYKKGYPVKVTIDRPATYFGFLLAERIMQASIPVAGSIVEKHFSDLNDADKVYEIQTPIKEVMTRCNRDSFGLAAEALLKTISANYTTGKINGEWKHGHHLVGKYLETLSIGKDEFLFDDGSGLSKENKLSPNLLCCIVYDIYNSEDWSFFKDTLAVGGVKGSGPVRTYFREPQYRGKIFAKSGTISGVKALSGVCSTASGDYIFSIITNRANSKTRAAINNIVKAIIDCN